MVTKLMEEVYRKIEKDEDVEPNNKILIDWINDKVDALYQMQRLIKESPDHICIGKLKYGDYETEIKACAWTIEDQSFLREFHIYKGLKALADAVGAEITHKPHGGTPEQYREAIDYEFTYRGIRFFQIEYAVLSK